MSQLMLDRVYHEKFIPCSVFHTHSCHSNAIRKFLIIFKMASTFYIPMHLFPVIVYKRDKILSEPLKILKNLLTGIVRSSLFVSVCISLFWYLICIFKNLRRRTDYVNILLASFICSFSILFEPAGRRIEIALYFLPRFLESVFLFFEKRGYIKSIENGEVVLFATAMSFLMYCYQNEEKNIKNQYLSMLKKYFGSN